MHIMLELTYTSFPVKALLQQLVAAAAVRHMQMA